MSINELQLGATTAWVALLRCLLSLIGLTVKRRKQSLRLRKHVLRRTYLLCVRPLAMSFVITTSSLGDLTANYLS